MAIEMRLGHENLFDAPREFFVRLGHARRIALCASCICNAPRACKMSGRNCLSMLPKLLNPALLAQTHVETLAINTSLPHSEFLGYVFIFSNLELRESLYLLLDFLGYVFIFSNLFLVTMCN